MSGTDAAGVIIFSGKSKGVRGKRLVGRMRLGSSEAEGSCVVVDTEWENRAGLAAAWFERRPGLGYGAAARMASWMC